MTGPQDVRPGGAASDPGPDPAGRRDVEELRAELGDTVEELVHRVDVPSRLREKRAETTERVQAQVTHAREVARDVVAEKAPAVQTAMRERPAVVGGVLAALLLLFVRSLRRRRKHREENVDGAR